MTTEKKIRAAYKAHVITGSSIRANLIHKFRQQNRNKDGTRYSYKEAAAMIDLHEELAMAS